jgi:hypothetical protein
MMNATYKWWSKTAAKPLPFEQANFVSNIYSISVSAIATSKLTGDGFNNKQ